MTYTYQAGDQQLRVVYELKAGWKFVSKRLVLTLSPGSTMRIDAAEVFRGELKTPVAREQKASSSSGAVFLRLGEPAAADKVRSVPRAAKSVPEVATQGSGKSRWATCRIWSGGQPTDRSRRTGCASDSMRLSGVEFPAHNIGEWKYVRDPQRAFEGLPALDQAEFDAVTALRGCLRPVSPRAEPAGTRALVRERLPDRRGHARRPQRSGNASSTRPPRWAASIRCSRRPTASLPRLKDNADAWGWENCLWLGLGQKIRKGEWDIAKDPIPPSIQEMLDYAKSKKVKLVAYAYPTLGWKQNPEWTAWCQRQDGRLRRRRHRRAQLPGLVRGPIGGVPEADGHQRLLFRSLVDRLRADERRLEADEQVRPMVRLPADPRRAPPPHPGRRDRRPPAVPVVRRVDLAGRLVSPSDDQRRAARQFQELSRPAFQPRFRRPAAMGQLVLPHGAIHAAGNWCPAT